MIDLIALSAAKKHADLLAMGLTSVSVDNTNKSITFTLAADGSQRTIYFDQPSDGVSIVGVEIKNGHLICLMSDGSEIDAGILPSGGSSGSSGSNVQPDWNQNDATQPDYVKNRPFYTGDPVETVLVEESTVAFADTGRGVYMGNFETTFVATIGETYKVSWDGTAYECTCISFNETPVIGNLSIVGEGSDTGEPFIMGVINGERIQIFTADTSASHTFSISGIVTPVVKIDPKYIRDMYYTKTAETVFVEESVVTFAPSDGVYMGVLQSTFSATVGETYKVSFDGTTYEYTCVKFSGLPVIGNLSLVGAGSDTGEPFLMMIMNGREIRIGTADTSASHTISISRWTTQVVKIDEKYLPDTVATKSDVEAVESTANDAQNTANNAQNTANKAQSTANNAQSTANVAKTTANNAQSTANVAKTTANAAKTAAENAVKYTSSQNLTDAQKEQARTNIGAGTSSFSGSWNDLTGKPLVPTDDHINELINTALSAIGIAEEGAY